MLRWKSILLMICLLLEIQPGTSQDKAVKIDRLMTAYYNNGAFNGVVLAAKNGRIIYEKAFGYADREWNIPNTVDTRFRIASLSKSFTALLVLKLYEQGKIDLNGTIKDYIPDYGGKAGDTITIHQLLTHTSGILANLDPDEEAIEERLYHPLREMVGYAESAGLYFAPGTGFRYSNLGYSMLAYIIEKVTGKTFAKVFKEEITIPLSLQGTSQTENHRIENKIARGYEYKLLTGFEKATPFDESYAVGPGGLISTARDLYIMDNSLYSDKLISKESREKIFSISNVSNYGYGWFISKKKIGRGMDSLLIADHSGSINGFGTYMARIPVDSGFVAVLKNQRSDTFIEPAYATDIGNQILSILYGDEVEIPRKSIAKNIGFLIGTKGIDYALSEYHRIAKDESETFNLEEMELNKLGIELYFRFKMTDEALEIFRINMLQYPGSYNTYDSYAYVLMKKGDYKNAIKYYKKGLEVLKSFPLENGSESVRNDSMKARQYIIEMEEKLK